MSVQITRLKTGVNYLPSFSKGRKIAKVRIKSLFDFEIGVRTSKTLNLYHIFICTCRGKFAGKSPIRTRKTYFKSCLQEELLGYCTVGDTSCPEDMSRGWSGEQKSSFWRRFLINETFILLIHGVVFSTSKKDDYPPIVIWVGLDYLVLRA